MYPRHSKKYPRQKGTLLNLLCATLICCERFVICCEHLVLMGQLWATVDNKYKPKKSSAVTHAHIVCLFLTVPLHLIGLFYHD